MTINVPETELQRLPEGAAYTVRKGQASLSVRREKDTIQVSAVCDSLLLVSEQYYKQIQSLQGIISQQMEQAEVVTKSSPASPLKWLFVGLALGAIGGLSFRPALKKLVAIIKQE